MSTIYVLPNGRIAENIVLHSYSSGDLRGRLDDDLDYTTDNDTLGSFSPIELFGDKVLMDANGSEALVRHCRAVEISDDIEAWMLDDWTAEAWPAEIMQACGRVRQLGDVIRLVDEIRLVAPRDFVACPTISAALDTIVAGRAQAEADALEKKIADWRAAHDKPVRSPDMEDFDADL